MKVQSCTIGLLFCRLAMPPPQPDSRDNEQELSWNVQLATAGLLP